MGSSMLLRFAKHRLVLPVEIPQIAENPYSTKKLSQFLTKIIPLKNCPKSLPKKFSKKNAQNPYQKNSKNFAQNQYKKNCPPKSSPKSQVPPKKLSQFLTEIIPLKNCPKSLPKKFSKKIAQNPYQKKFPEILPKISTKKIVPLNYPPNPKSP